MARIPPPRTGPVTRGPIVPVNVSEPPEAPVTPPIPSREEERPATRATPNVIVQPQDRILAVAGEGALIPRCFGRTIVQQPRVVAVAASGDNLVLAVLWCKGPIQGVVAVYNGDQDITSSCVSYDGTQTTPDPVLAAAISGYADNLEGFAYSRITLSTSDTSITAAFRAELDGELLFDPRGPTTAYSPNPALMFRAVATEKGLSVDDTNIGFAADYCEELLPNSRLRREVGLTFDRPASIERVLQTLAEYAGSFFVREAGIAKLVPDRPTASSSSFTDADITRNSITLEKTSLNAIPDQVRVEYLKRTSWPWRAIRAPADFSSTGERETVFRMPGFVSWQAARRHAIERLNRYRLSDLKIRMEVQDEALAVEVGDVIDVTSSEIGLSAKEFRVLQVKQSRSPGTWIIQGEEYDPAIYSDNIETDPTSPDLDLPNPTDIPNGPTPAMEEVVFEDEAGRWFSRFRITWSGLDWPFVRSYRVQVSAGGDIVLETNVNHLGQVQHEVATPAVKQDVSYLVRVWTVNTFGEIGNVPGEASAVAQGKRLLPSAPQNLRGFEAGQFVSLNWDPAVDLDLVGYRIKRIPQVDYDANVPGAWDDPAAVVVAERIDAELALLNAQPVGAFYYMVKALDSLGQLSDSPTPPYGRADRLIQVTAENAGQFIIDELSYLTLVNMHPIRLYGQGIKLVTSAGRTWTDIFGAAGSLWTDGYAAAETWVSGEAVVSSVLSEEFDLGADKDGNWTWSVNTITLQGAVTATTKIAKAADYPTFTDVSGTSFAGESRYLQAFLECTGNQGDGMEVFMPFLATVQGNIVEEDRVENIPASGQPLSITWDKTYVSPPQVILTVQGAAPRIVTVDSITITGADLYAWDSAGAAAAATVNVRTRGI